MNTKIENNDSREKIIEEICDFLGLDRPIMYSSTTEEAIKELCVARLCKAIGLTGVYNYKSDFFEFFSSIMGEAVCEKLAIKIRIACDELRLFRFERVNLVERVKSFLETESVEEAFLDAFELADKFKYIIPELKKCR
jgi:hypothetical protein